MESIFGGLIEFDNREGLDEFINNLTVEDAIQIIEKQIDYVASQGGFKIIESHVLYKCLNKLKEKNDTTI